MSSRVPLSRRRPLRPSCISERDALGEDGQELAPGEIAEIVTKSDCVMKGYWNNPEANARALRDGWLWTD